MWFTCRGVGQLWITFVQLYTKHFFSDLEKVNIVQNLLLDLSSIQMYLFKENIF